MTKKRNNASSPNAEPGFDLLAQIRPELRDLQPYTSARSTWAGGGVLLDANENPYGTLNRYPSPDQKQVRERLARLKGLSPENIFIGNGSDEIIDLAFRLFCRPGIDSALNFSPTYGMYRVSAAINAVTLRELPLTADFDLPEDAPEQISALPNLKLIFICSPNNPTGNLLSSDIILRILQNTSALVIVDEAYIDFASAPSFSRLIDLFPNLIVLQTMSKAWGLASARVGMAFAQKQVLDWFRKIKPPYNVSGLNQAAALKALSDLKAFERRKKMILEERDRLEKYLLELPQILRVYPSDANFLLTQTVDSNRSYQSLAQQ
ncbi:MAG: histidinol-phosphate transaminase, partial [Bacteroidota bacterium]